MDESPRGRFAYFDREADIVWLPTAPAGDIVGDEQSWGLIDRDRETGEVTGIEIWTASEILPEWLLDDLPRPRRRRGSET
jgi:uncharacterized protein YuzE